MNFSFFLLLLLPFISLVTSVEVGGKTDLYLDEKLTYAFFDDFNNDMYAAWLAVGTWEGMSVKISSGTATLTTTEIWHGWHGACLGQLPTTCSTSSYFSLAEIDHIEFKIKSSSINPKEIKYLLAHQDDKMGNIIEKPLTEFGVTDIKDWTEVKIPIASYKSMKAKTLMAFSINDGDNNRSFDVKDIKFATKDGGHADILSGISWPKSTGSTDPPEKAMEIGTTIKKNGIELKLEWADEFIQDEELPDPTVWGYDVGDGMQENSDGTHSNVQDWGNGEQEWYTKDNPKNAFVSDGTLKIKAIKETYKGKPWTSARLVTRNLKEFKYGYFEFRAKIPETAGVWPAIWMLRADINEGGLTWPDCGEIDIVETSTAVFGLDKVCGTLHCKAGSGGNPIYGGSLRMSELEDKWHLYALYWNEKFISWYYDDQLVGKYVPASITDNDVWPYNQDFYLILNLAVGGTLGGGIPAGLTESTLEFDYVRYFSAKGDGNEGDNGAGNPGAGDNDKQDLDIVYEVDPDIPKPFGLVTDPKDGGRVNIAWGYDGDHLPDLFIIYVDGKAVAQSIRPASIPVYVTTNGEHEFGVAAIKDGKSSEMTTNKLKIDSV